MRLIVVTLLLAISYAQTVTKEMMSAYLRRQLQDPDAFSCPDGLVSPSVDFVFLGARVVHRNLGGQYCDPARWFTTPNGGSIDGTVPGVTYPPPECVDKLPDGTTPIPEILYMDVGTLSNGQTVGMRVVDVSADYPDATPFACENTLKCGNVKEPNSVFGQVQLEMGGEVTRLRFSLVACDVNDPNNDLVEGYTQDKCVPIEWDSMVMTFLDIDGNSEQETLIGHDIYNYIVFYDIQSEYSPSFTPIEWTDGLREDAAFPDMKIRVDDPDSVYMARETGDELNPGPQVWNNNVGDVTFRNMHQNPDLEGERNGDHTNPTQLLTLTEGQLQRGVQVVWVSQRLREYAVSVSQGAPDFDTTVPRATTFDVSMGTAKRTIEFAGFSQGLVGSEICRTCATGFFSFNDCPNPNDITYPNRVCEYAPEGIDSCNADYCCEPQVTTSHGDPIIWTFDNECYDLSKDGLYLATSHPDYDHDVKLAVYNDFMREIQVVDRATGEIILAISSLGEVLKSDKYKYFFEHETKVCPEDIKKTECNGEYEEWTFDAQSFAYTAILLRHDYLDPALKEGELGYHLDVSPVPYNSFNKRREGYTGLYFENPLPEELEYCPGGSPKYSN